MLTLHLLICLLPGCQGACPLPCQLAKPSCLIIVIRDLHPVGQQNKVAAAAAGQKKEAVSRQTSGSCEAEYSSRRAA
jgi:hypothetical protein